MWPKSTAALITQGAVTSHRLLGHIIPATSKLTRVKAGGISQSYPAVIGQQA